MSQNTTQPKQTNLIEYTYAKKMLSLMDNQDIPSGNSALDQIIIRTANDFRFFGSLDHMIKLGATKMERIMLTQMVMRRSASKEILQRGLLGEISTVLAPASKTNTGNTNVVLTQPQTEEEGNK
jgi:hypothetical protein